MAKKSKEEISLDISNYWTSSDLFTESNNKCGTLVAFDWVDDYLTEINTNIDLDRYFSAYISWDFDAQKKAGLKKFLSLSRNL